MGNNHDKHRISCYYAKYNNKSRLQNPIPLYMVNE